LFYFYSCILAAEKIPDFLIDQLANGGRMMIPVGGINENQYICIVDKDLKGVITKRNVLAVRYVPLTDKNTQLFG
jgi:protein-L-isoaspartate(D-aspartate) O-methyltransferase